MGDEPEIDGAAATDLKSDVAADAAQDAGYRVELPIFEGPLDLLLHLIQQHELDIFDIPIAFITQKYVEYVTLMQDLNIDVASEYLVMAATLTHIKSKMLLPASPEDDEDEDEVEVDPRAELVRRLLEYQKYKLAADQLGDRSILGRDVFSRGAPAPSVDGPAPLAPLGLFKLLDAFQAVLKRAKQSADHQIDVDRFSISDRINELSDILRGRGRVQFEELFSADQSRGDLIVTFLALLEMTRVRLIRLMQAGPLEPISIELAVSDTGDEDPEEAIDEATRPARDSEAVAATESGARSSPTAEPEGDPQPGSAGGLEAATHAGASPDLSSRSVELEASDEQDAPVFHAEPDAGEPLLDEAEVAAASSDPERPLAPNEPGADGDLTDPAAMLDGAGHTPSDGTAPSEALAATNIDGQISDASDEFEPAGASSEAQRSPEKAGSFPQRGGEHPGSPEPSAGEGVAATAEASDQDAVDRGATGLALPDETKPAQADPDETEPAQADAPGETETK